MTGVAMMLFKDFIQQKFNKIGKVWGLVGTIILASAITFMGFSIESIEPKM